MAYTIGLDYGTNSVRCVIVDVADGSEIGASVFEYPTGQAGIILDSSDHNLARQNPADYIEGLETSVKGAIAQVKKSDKNFKPQNVIGIGIDTTGSTPLPVDKNGTPLALLDEFNLLVNDLAKRVGKSSSVISNMIRLTDLPEKPVAKQIFLFSHENKNRLEYIYIYIIVTIIYAYTYNYILKLI